MSPSRVSLSRRDAEAIIRGPGIDGHTVSAQTVAHAQAVERLAASLRLSEKRRTVSRQRKASKTEKRAKKRERRGNIRAAVVARANGVCECGCGHRLDEDGFLFRPEMDHFFGKSRSESIETCWLLAAAHHERKTQNFPSRVAWLEKFIEHCQRHGHYERGGRHHYAKLNEEQVRSLLERRLSGEKVRGLASAFNVGVSTVEDILYGKTWRHVTFKVAEVRRAL